MSIVSIFGSTALDSGAGYSVDPDRNPITVATRVALNASGGSVVGIRFYAPVTGLTGAWAYLQAAGSATVLAALALPSPMTVGWNEVFLDAPAAITNAAWWYAAVYLPNGGFPYKANVFVSPVVSPDDSHLIGVDDTNGGFDANTQATPATPTLPAAGSWATFGATHYGVDVLVDDPTVGGATLPANTSAPAITTDGTPQTTETVSCSNGSWSGTIPLTYAYQWKRNNVAISGATTANYMLQVADQGQSVKCTVTASNAAGSVGADSNTITPSAPPVGSPANTVPPLLSGKPRTGLIVNCSTGTWTGSPTSYAYQWKRNGVAIIGAVLSGYTIISDDVGKTLSCVVSATNVAGTVSATSDNTFTPIQSPAPTDATVRMWIPIDGAWEEAKFGGVPIRVRNEGGMRPEDGYGTLGGSDDSPVLEACIADGVKRALDNGSGYTEILLDPSRVYNLTRAPVAGGNVGIEGVSFPALGFAQVRTPALDPTANPKVTIRIVGFGQASAMHWMQTANLKGGAVLKSTVRSALYDATYGAPSVLGSPTMQVGSFALAPWYSNVHVITDGITFMMPPNPGMICVDMRGAAEYSFDNCNWTVDANPTYLNANPPTDDGGLAVYMPSPGNNAVLDAARGTIVGYTYGIGLAEHFTALRIMVLYCNTALYLVNDRGREGQSTKHGIFIGRIVAEAIQTLIHVGGSARFQVQIPMADLELIGSTQYHIDDNADILHGRIELSDYQETAYRIRGANNLKIVSMWHPRGVSTITLPASGAAIPVVYRDRMVYINGGTVSNVTINGTSIGARTQFELQSGKTAVVTYTGTPTFIQDVD